MNWSRRAFVRGSAALAGTGLFVPLRGLSRPVGYSDRKFLFIYCFGGADQATVFAPTFDNPAIPDEMGATLGTVGDLTFVDHIDRPSVRSFLEAYGAQTCFLHGLEVRSISHERCQQLMLTGSADAAADDWPAMLAGHANEDMVLPALVHSGPSFSSRYTDIIVRLGETGQLSRVLDGTALADSIDTPVDVPPASVSGLVDAYLSREAVGYSAASPAGGAGGFADAYGQALARLDRLKEIATDVDLSVETSKQLPQKVRPMLDCLEKGLTRCAMVEYRGVNEEGFDTHSANARQSGHFEEMFGYLNDIVDDVAARTGSSGGSLLDELCIVVFSEMGRHPLLNALLGKDHWTYTSVMLVGSGVNGGRVYGGYDENGQGAPIDPASGAVHESGVQMLSSHLGATLLAMGDIDPTPYLPGIEPITALIGG